jgi:hypothetical protein
MFYRTLAWSWRQLANAPNILLVREIDVSNPVNFSHLLRSLLRASNDGH